MGERPEPMPQVVQAPANSVSALLGEVDHIVQAIKSIRRERQLQRAQGEQVEAEPARLDDISQAFKSIQLQEAQGKQVAAEPSDALPLPDKLPLNSENLESDSRSCLCGMPCHYFSEMMELGGSEMDVKVQAASCKCVCRLLFLLSDSYFRLGRAYKEDGQYNRALKAILFAHLTRHSCTRNSILSCGWSRNRDPKAAEFARRMRRLTPPPKEVFFPKGASFYSHACILAGDAYFEAQRTFDDSDVVVPHQEGEELTMAPEVKDEVYRVVKACSGTERCFGNGWRYLDLNWAQQNAFLPIYNNWEQNLSAAIEFYFNALPSFIDKLALGELESEYPEIEDSEKGSGFTKITCRKMGFVCHEFGRRLAELGWDAKDETKENFQKAIRALYRGKDLPNLKLALCNSIEYHRELAEFRETQQGPEGRVKTMEEARAQYQEALNLCGEAKNRLRKRGDLLCKEVDTEEARTYFKLGMFLVRGQAGGAKQEWRDHGRSGDPEGHRFVREVGS